MIATVHSAAVRGIDSYLVRVEVSLTSGLPSFTIVGLPQGAVRESRERVVAALRNAGHGLPPRRITVNLAPAGIRKAGAGLDLPLAVGLLQGCGVIEPAACRGVGFVGELGLDGALRPVPGVLPMVEGCRAGGLDSVIVPRANASEGAAVRETVVYGAETLFEVIEHLRGRTRLEQAREGREDDDHPRHPDLEDVRGQALARRALEVAAAGGHNVLFVGPPGSGKSMLARRLPGILPPPSDAEAIEITRIRSVAGLLGAGEGIVRHRPFRSPHHTVSEAGLVGGGSVLPRPGEVTLAHRGVLFLDELPEYRRGALESLRQPLEDGSVSIFRTGGGVRFPARLQLVAAMNPCPCGFAGDPERPCVCDPAAAHRYRTRISGPLLDRIDLHVTVARVPVKTLRAEEPGERSMPVRARVVAAREVQGRRFGDGIRTNASMDIADLAAACPLESGVGRFLERAVDRLRLSARAYHRILRVARTLADLEGVESLAAHHVAEAVQYRSLDRAA